MRFSFSSTLALGLGLLLVAGCGTSPSEEKTPTQVYVVDGVVSQLPAAAGTELMIRHAAIPDFVNAQGDTVGMNAMTMGFPTAEGVSLEGFAVGDRVRFTFEVRWGGSPPLQLTAIQPR